MPKKIITPSNVHAARGYSHAIRVGNTIYVSGQIGLAENGELAPGGFEGQARQALENLKRVLEAAGATIRDIVKLNTYVKNMEDMTGYRELRRTYFADHYPASTLVQIVALARPDLLIEIEAIAVVD